MIQIVIYLVFIVSVAMAAGSIVLSSKLRGRNNLEIFSILLYYEVFMFTFGFYGMWGQVLIKVFLSPYISPEIISKFTDIALLLGLPFLVIGWMMLIKLACGISGRVCANRFTFWFLLMNFTILGATGYLIAAIKSVEPALILKLYFISMNFVFTLAASYMILNRGTHTPPINHNNRMVAGLALIAFCLLQCAPLFFYFGQVYLGILVILIFFTSNAFLPVYFSYGIELTTPIEEQKLPASFENFCRKYDVSQRESEIIREICNGFSNKEIADRLFITLQTVKDHTHRIYIKTNVKSRVQLINLVNGTSS